MSQSPSDPVPVPNDPPDLPPVGSLWVESAPDLAPRSALDADATTDVAIVGGGIAGMTTALFCARAGLSVLVLEADRVGTGTTGHATVKVTAAHGTTYRTIADRHGVEAAATYASANRWGMDEIVRLVGQLGIGCDLERVAHCVYADTEEQVEIIDAEFEAERAAGLDVERVDTLDLPFEITAAIRNGDQAIFHPVKYVRGLADAVEAEGGRIVEGTRVTAVDGDDELVVLTDVGEVRAEHVVIATHAPIRDHGLLFSRYLPTMEYAIAVKTRDAVPSESYIYCTDPTRSMRWVDVEGERLLIVVGEGHKVGEEPGVPDPYTKLFEWTDARWGIERVVHRWCTHDLFGYDGLPIMGRFEGAEREYVLTAFGSWGMTNATAGAAIVRDAILGSEHEWASFFAPSGHHTKGGTVEALKENVKAVGSHLVGDRLRRHGGDVTELEPGSGDVFRMDGREVAVSRDEDGGLHAVSAICTHLRCIVSWNVSEGTWDCPCHGSRFGVDGEVISAPATEPLERVDLDLA